MSMKAVFAFPFALVLGGSVETVKGRPVSCIQQVVSRPQLKFSRCITVTWRCKFDGMNEI